MNFKDFLLVGLGGAVGSMARYGAGVALTKFLHHQPVYPVGTFCINIVGSFIIGLLFGLTARHQLPAWGVLLFSSGFCGGFTTFSTFALDNINLMQKGESAVALLYIALSVVIGLLLCRVGIWLVR